MHERLAAHIRQKQLMRAGERVGVAVSGGADSVALFRLLLDLRQELGIVVSVVHFNHKLRGEESDQDEAFVHALASEYGLEFLSESGETRAHAAGRKIGIEAAARDLRYAFFWKLLSPQENARTLDRIATAHTLDDQAETVLMRFARGAGTRGLTGIHPVLVAGDDRSSGNEECGTVVRPLLEFRRAQLRHFLKRAGQEWREDASNQDPAYARNRLRQQFMPKLRELNPAVEMVLSETAEIARAEEEYWAGVIAEALREVTEKSPEKNPAALDVTLLMSLPLAVRRRVLRQFAERHGLRLEFHHVEQVLEVAADAAARVEKRVELTDRWDACLSESRLHLRKREDKTVNTDYELVLPVPGKVRVEAAGIVVCAKVTQTGKRLKPRELRVRNWRPGDRYWPSHTGSEKKVKELLQDRRVPAQHRGQWPVVIDAATGQIVWVPGFPYPDACSIDEGPGVLLETTERI